MYLRTSAAKSKHGLGNDQKANQGAGKSNDKDQVLFDSLMAYISYAMQNSAIENIQQVVLGNFTAQAVNSSKDLLWEKCDLSIIGEKVKRRDSQVRTDKEANLHDIFSALVKLDKQNKLPKITNLGSLFFPL